MPIFVVFRDAGPSWVKDRPAREQPYWTEHARFIDGLFDGSKILLAGPFSDGSGALLIVNVESKEMARTLFDDDPWTNHGILRTGDVKEFQIFLNAFE